MINKAKINISGVAKIVKFNTNKQAMQLNMMVHTIKLNYILLFNSTELSSHFIVYIPSAQQRRDLLGGRC